MPILAFLAFCSRSGLCDFFIEDGFCCPQDKKEQKSTQGTEQKGIQKSGKKSALISYLDNIELKCVIFDFYVVVYFVKICSLILIFGGLRDHTGGCCVVYLIKSCERTSHNV